MANFRDLLKRRKAVRNIRRITKTMELIATAHFKKAMDRALQADAYTRKIAELASDLTQAGGDITHPLLSVRPVVKRSLLLVLGSNRGLCGGYNGTILREATVRLRELQAAGTLFDLELSGKRPIAFFKFQRIPATRTYIQFEDKPTFAEVEPVADHYIEAYTSGHIDRVEVAYMKFLNAGRQRPVVETLLPLSSVGASTPAPTKGPSVDYIYLPDAGDILNDLVPAAFKARLFKCFLDAAVSEQIARRVAMKSATENAGDLIKTLSVQYNRARQGNITREIMELIAGAEALK